ncbi:MAG TPA: PfkB family carbohydrate kinase [Cytophagaceae bacterium]|jgi:nucleoside 2-deoxyribosyltransferase
MTLNIIGGTYGEVCIDPVWREIYGSGLRAAHALSSYNVDIILHTCIGNDDLGELTSIANSINVQLSITPCDETHIFTYDYPLASPRFNSPKTGFVCINVTASNILQFGMIEGGASVEAEQVVYDPQSPSNPQSFWNNGSKTNKLIWIANLEETSKFAGSQELSEIRNYLFNKERVYAAVIKKGSDGAIVMQDGEDDLIVPAFKTNKVWPIGTGDIFSASFAYHYFFKQLTIADSAWHASLFTAFYSETIVLPLPEKVDQLKYDTFLKVNDETIKKVYLAGPFFSMAQRWLIEQCRNQLLKFGLDVFSPYHDVGLGVPEHVVSLDIDALNDADIVLAVLDGLDTGTIFEIGFAKSRNIPVIVFAESQEGEAFTMIKGSGCIIESDFSTAIYKTVWEVYK